ncbi:diguanylate cyclase (GGDEF) domain-containing protein [Colwellia chukchiensis]|uniref:Diguanylate cyclase (GGDEF) domain-containing protein n=1 Tax=Colwellia chukchiensis TaxID=641665 RepID=A0A1H7RUM7_9GAMM|nr:transporter substrate-binding domain-containing protein [Colwellia chukchiensis]SEL63980.1 diguanylate cyclase (GGDEF) domain-containing protein [Colwellia chukchiensis]
MKINLFIKNIILLVTGLMLLAMSLASAQGQETRKSYKIAINKTSYPFHFLDQNNHADGMMVELWQLWAQKQNVDVEFVALNWQQTIAQVRSGQLDIHAGLSKNATRATFFDFSDELVTQNQHLFLHRSIAHIRKISQLSAYTIGVVTDSSHDISLTQNYPELTLRRFANRHALYQAALQKEVLIIAGGEKLSKHFVDYQVLNDAYPIYARVSYDKGSYGVAVAKGQAALLAFIEQGMKKISAAEKSEIIRKWLGIDRAENVITISYVNQQMPFSGSSANGNAQGFFVELWQLWARFSDVNVEFVVLDASQPQSISQVSADIHINSLVADDSRAGLSVGSLIYRLDYSVFLTNQHAGISHILELENRNIAVVATPGLLDDLTRSGLKANLVYFQDYPSLFAALNEKEFDAFVGQRDVIEYYLSEQNLQANFFRLPSYKYQQPIHAMLNNSNPALRQLVVDGFDEVSLQSLVGLEQKWHLDQSAGYFKRQLTQLKLTEQEALWLKDHSKIRFGVTNNWVPVEFVDKFGEVKGTNPDLFNILAQRLDIEIEYVVYNDFENLYQALLAGDVDAIGSLTATQERKKQVLFTESYWSMPWVIVHPRELGKQLHLDSFNNKTLAITKGYYFAALIRQQYPAITLLLVENSEEGLLAVQKGVVDGFIDSLSSGTELLKKESLVSLSMSILDEMDKDSNHIAVNKSLPLLANILNKAVQTLSDEDSQKVYEKWFAISIETGLDKSVVLRVAAQIGVLIIIVIVIIIIWNRRLYSEIRNRKALEKQMQYMATHDDLTGLANRVLLKDRLNTAIPFHQRQNLLLAVLFIDLDGFKNINDSRGHDIGDELLIEVAKRLTSSVRNSDTVVRFGGDEFVLLLTGLHHKNEAAYVADKVLKLIQQPIALDNSQVAIGCSIGIAIYPNDGDSGNELLKVADALMYKVKAAGKNHFMFNQ